MNKIILILLSCVLGMQNEKSDEIGKSAHTQKVTENNNFMNEDSKIYNEQLQEVKFIEYIVDTNTYTEATVESIDAAQEEHDQSWLEVSKIMNEEIRAYLNNNTLPDQEKKEDLLASILHNKKEIDTINTNLLYEQIKNLKLEAGKENYSENKMLFERKIEALEKINEINKMKIQKEETSLELINEKDAFRKKLLAEELRNNVKKLEDAEDELVKMKNKINALELQQEK